MKQMLLDKIKNKQIEVGVVGLGYVGLPLAVEKAKAGFKTIGFDVQAEKVKLVNEGHNYMCATAQRRLPSTSRRARWWCWNPPPIRGRPRS